ncbi:EAL domain-containing protein [Shewanella sp.]|uniref:putative bifunctional diguanylate cyclase/phosphodiesterase n=1 Tax=Shewanella sp. TaxID=50422 RepID=UPI001ECDBBA5|nr:EAL domain-containing protein [Shewanella sp.]NRB25049.1 EAL domain-containing protein [Shewanella sp.]
MNIKKWFNSQTAIIIGGILLTAYLFLILTVTNIGQSRLQESQNHALDLKVSNYSDNLSFFFDVSQENITHLATNRAFNTYFANLAAGMSLQYGLSSSLFSLRQAINQFSQKNMIDNVNIYRRLMVIGVGGTVIADTHPDTAFDMSQVPFEFMDVAQEKILMFEGLHGPSITLLRTIYHQSKPAAILIAEVNQDVVINRLSTQEHESSGSWLKLVTPLGEIQVWDSLKPLAPLKSDWGSAVHGARGRVHAGHLIDDHSHSEKNIYLESAIAGTPFKLVSWFEPVNEDNIFTSTWFVVAISLLALPVLFGLWYLMRVNNTNLILQTQIEVSSDQQLKLTHKNSLLHKEIHRRKASENKLAYRAMHDELTGLSNRTHGMVRLEDAIGAAKDNRTQVLVMFLDLDNFKQINDTVGHHAGDNLLQQVSERLLTLTGTHDTVARFGGDEFLIIIPDVSHQDRAKALGSAILKLFEQPFNIDGQEFFESTSIGMSVYPKDGDNAAALLKKADSALYRVKDAGRNGFSFYDASMNRVVKREQALNGRLHQAVNLDEIEVYYQVILDLESRDIIGAEALLRWTDSELGVVSPIEFIPLAEKNGLIHRLGDMVLFKACKQAAAWQSISPIKIAINFSSVQFRYCEQLESRIVEVLAQTGLPASKLEMEVTESLLIEQGDSLMNMLSNLNRLGIELSIDDFGTGYSALSYLQKYPFSKLKIDRAFISKMATSKADKSLVKAILAMAKSLELKVVAEGIEYECQAQFLQDYGCEFGQGYLFGRPVSAKALTLMLMAQHKKTVTG